MTRPRVIRSPDARGERRVNEPNESQRMLVPARFAVYREYTLTSECA
jgi:hypothetical protein